MIRSLFLGLLMAGGLAGPVWGQTLPETGAEVRWVTLSRETQTPEEMVFLEVRQGREVQLHYCGTVTGSGGPLTFNPDDETLPNQSLLFCQVAYQEHAENFLLVQEDGGGLFLYQCTAQEDWVGPWEQTSGNLLSEPAAAVKTLPALELELKEWKRKLQVTKPRLQGDDVTAVQLLLHRIGHDEAGEADGWYGPQTAGAVGAFQGEAGLPVTGEVDQATWAALADRF